MRRSPQLGVSLVMLAAVCGTFLAVLPLARFSPVIDNHVERELARFEETNGFYLYDAGYRDDGDYVLLGQLPRDDYSRGGVYFIGSSETNTALMPWRMTPAEQRLIHNYSIGDFRHSEIRHYVRMLVEDNGLLEAGAERTTVILTVNYTLARRKRGEQYVRELFPRHQLYTYDWDEGIRRVPMSPVRREYILARDLTNRFLRILFLSPTRVETPSADDPFKAHLGEVMVDDWREVMESEVSALTATIDYLQAHGANVWAVYPPMMTWHDERPHDAIYREMITPIMVSRGVRVTDFGDLLPDEDFADALHARYSGQAKSHVAYHALALEALEAMGTTIEDSGEPVRAELRQVRY